MTTTFEQIAFIPEQQKPLNRARTAGASASRTVHGMAPVTVGGVSCSDFACGSSVADAHSHSIPSNET